MKAAFLDSPIDDLTFDLVTVLHKKAQALEAYAKYLEDARDDDDLRELFEDIRRADAEHVEALKDALAQRLSDEVEFGSEDEEDEEEDLEEEDDSDIDVESTGRR
jgi:rubrerythrin